MSRPSISARTLLLLSSAFFGLGAGCSGDKSTTEDDGVETYPVLELSANRLDFSTVNWGETHSREFTITNPGDLDMGIESIALRDGEMEENFTVTYAEADIDCPTSASSARTASPLRGRASADVGDDTATAGDTGGDTAGDTGGTALESSTGPLMLGAGCNVPVTVTLSPATVGEILSSIEVKTYTETGDGSPAFYKDPDNVRGVVILEGEADKTRGNLVASPTTIDFGQVYDSQNPTDFITIRNVGTADLTLGAPVLADDCTEGFSILDAFADGRVLEPDTSALIEVEYAPVSEDRARCDVVFTSDDPDAGTVTIALQANLGGDTSNSPPTVVIRSPDPGYLITSLDSFEVEVNIFDADQPASTISCNLRSAVTTLDTLVEDCSPTDDSGHVFIEIDPNTLETGVDALVVTVKDGEGETATAGVSILYRADFPESDDDGDGFGDDATDPEAEIDCDDDDMLVFPFATEIYDSKDNDCDGTVDEGTEGGDDDVDGFSEVDGDCDDTNPDTWPEAGETGDHQDNDCDSIVDEGTSLYDDDEDGFSETEDDCDDTDITINPSAEEICDGYDNDCNGLKDQQDGCISLDSDPIIVGGIQMGVTALGVGESTTMTVLAYDADGQNLLYAWQQDPKLTTLGENTIDNPNATSITFTAPSALPEGSTGEVYYIYVTVFDEDGNQAYEPGEITVLSEPVALERTTTTTTGCGESSSALVFPLLPALAAAGLLRRRRRNMV